MAFRPSFAQGLDPLGKTKEDTPEELQEDQGREESYPGELAQMPPHGS